MADPVVTLTNGVPTAGSGTITTLGQTLLDGANVTIGAKADAAQTDPSQTASLMAFIKGLLTGIVLKTSTAVIGKVKLTDGTTDVPVLAASSGAPAATVPAIPVSIRDTNANGQAVMASSAPVVIASDQSALTTQLAASANIVSGAITTAMTGTTSTSLVAAPGASLRNYITTIIVSNSHATVGTDVIIQDGSGGTTLLTIPAAAVYGGGVISLPVPLRQPTTNAALYCANITTGSSTKVSAVGFKAA